MTAAGGTGGSQGGRGGGGGEGGGSGEGLPPGRVLLTEATAQWRRDDLPTGEQLPGAPSVPPPSLDQLRAAGRIGERWEHFLAADRARAEQLGALGIELHSVRQLQLPGERQEKFQVPDAFVVGTEHTVEMKMPETPTFNAFRSAVREARRQSPRLVLFVDALPVSEAEAVRWLQRSLGRYGGLQEVLVIGDGFGTLWP